MKNTEKIKIIQFHNNQLGFDCPCALRASGKFEIHDESRMPKDETELEEWKIGYDNYILAEEKNKIIEEISNKIQAFLDDKAKEYGYDSIHTAVTYADESTVSKFQTEGAAFRKWRSGVWAKCYEILAEVESGSREQPTIEELLIELPALAI